MIGRTISHYTILEKLGEGGMGVVYKANDTRLNRIVALKFLPDSVNEGDAARFLVEARAASALNHPNVCGIHSIGEFEGKQFIDMEYIDGVTLGAKIRSGAMSVVDTVRYGAQIGEALQEAHGKGIVHRDVKAENVMINSRDHVKVMDFGLAKLKGALRLTKSARTVGTLAYMAPECIRGDDADQRSDIFSFGALLFEMLTGKTPFRGEHDAAMMYAILNEAPLKTGSFRNDVPEAVNAAIHRALEKNPAERYQSIQELVSDLRGTHHSGLSAKGKSAGSARGRRFSKRLLSAVGLAALVVLLILLLVLGKNGVRTSDPAEVKLTASGQPLYRLAILPFRNLGGDEQSDFLGFALSDNIITNLSYVRSISVCPSSAVARYVHENPGTKQIADDLGANVILTGGYVREGDNLHLNTQLVDVSANQIVWQKQLDVNEKGILSLQKVVTTEIVKGLSLKLSSSEEDRVDGHPPANPEVYEMFLRAKAIGLSTDIRGLQSAVALFDQCTRREPTFYDAYVSRGYCLLYLGIITGDRSAFVTAERSLTAALAIDSTLPSGLSTLGFLYIQTGDKERAYPLLQRAVSEAPNISDIHNNLAYFYRLSGLFQESLDEVAIALALNPGDRRSHAYKAWVLTMMGRFDESIAASGAGLQRFPGDVQLMVMRSIAYFGKGELDSMNSFARQASQIDPTNMWVLVTTAMADAATMERTKSLAIADTITPHLEVDMESLMTASLSFAALGMGKKTASAIRMAMQWGYDGYPWLEAMPCYDNVRSDPDFRMVSEEMRKNFERLRRLYGKAGTRMTGT